MKHSYAAFASLCFLSACGTGPVVNFTTVPATSTVDRYARFEFSASGADTFSCTLDGVKLAACASPLLLTPGNTGDAVLIPGAHTLTVQAASKGIWGAAQSVSWNIESVLQQAQTNNTSVSSMITTAGELPPDYTDASSVTDKTPYLKGIARFQCLESHAAYDDPIVYPGMPGHAHLHSFWGNILADAYSTVESLFSDGDSTCQGQRLNRSAYWVPALLAPVYDSGGARTGWQPVLKDADDKALANDLFHETYYYSAVITDVSAITVPPIGLRIIAGTATATADAPANNQVLDDPNYIAHWYCAQRGSTPGRQTRYDSHVAECPITYDALGRENSLVHYVIRFPSCWDGSHLDSTDHKSHMAYPVFETQADGAVNRNTVQCPADHPVAIPEVSYHYSFTVTNDNADPITKTSRGWRLASDNYTVGAGANDEFIDGGFSLHGDWFNAWHPEVLQAFIDGCLKQRKNCSNGQLGTPSDDGVTYTLGAASRSADPVYPTLPNTELSGMPEGMTMQH